VAADASFEGGTHSSSPPIGPGLVVLVVGPSGAGKDAVIREVRDRLAHDTRFVFPRRIVTREASGAEDHASTTPADFEARLRQGAFALHWQAHGLHYGIPAQIDDAVRCGSTILFNASRHAAPPARSRYSNAAVVIIDAPLEVRAARLAARGREHGEEIASRLVRLVPGFSTADADFVIDNTGTVARAADLLVAWLRARHSHLAAPPA